MNAPLKVKDPEAMNAHWKPPSLSPCRIWCELSRTEKPNVFHLARFRKARHVTKKSNRGCRTLLGGITSLLAAVVFFEFRWHLDIVSEMSFVDMLCFRNCEFVSKRSVFRQRQDPKQAATLEMLIKERSGSWLLRQNFYTASTTEWSNQDNVFLMVPRTIFYTSTNLLFGVQSAHASHLPSKTTQQRRSTRTFFYMRLEPKMARKSTLLDLAPVHFSICHKYTSSLLDLCTLRHTSVQSKKGFLGHANLLRMFLPSGLTMTSESATLLLRSYTEDFKTPRASLAISRAFRPRTLVSASAKISFPDLHLKMIPCSISWSRRAAARTQKCRFLHVVTECKMLEMHPELSERSSTLKVAWPINDRRRFKMAIAVTHPRPAACTSASAALCC